MNPFKSWPQRLLEVAFAVLVAALMLNWAWALLRPLVPVIGVVMLLVIGLGVLSLVVRWLLVRHRGW